MPLFRQHTPRQRFSDMPQIELYPIASQPRMHVYRHRAGFEILPRTSEPVDALELIPQQVPHAPRLLVHECVILARVEVLGLVQDDHVVLRHVLDLACMYGSRRWRRRRPLRFSSLASREPVDCSPALPLIWHAMSPSVWATVFFNQASTLAAEVWT